MKVILNLTGITFYLESSGFIYWQFLVTTGITDGIYIILLGVFGYLPIS